MERFKDRPFSLIGVNSDEGTAEVLRKKFEREGITWRNALDGDPAGPIAKLWKVEEWPSVFIIDANGRVRASGPKGEKIGKWVEILLKELEKK